MLRCNDSIRQCSLVLCARFIHCYESSMHWQYLSLASSFRDSVDPMIHCHTSSWLLTRLVHVYLRRSTSIRNFTVRFIIIFSEIKKQIGKITKYNRIAPPTWFAFTHSQPLSPCVPSLSRTPCQLDIRVKLWRKYLPVLQDIQDGVCSFQFNPIQFNSNSIVLCECMRVSMCVCMCENDGANDVEFESTDASSTVWHIKSIERRTH